GAVSGNALAGTLRVAPDDPSITDSLLGVPAELIIDRIAKEIKQLGLTEPPTHIGLGIPGIVRHGIVEDSPNLVQFKGVHVRDLLKRAVEPLFGKVPVSIFNDADVMAAGMAATRGHLDKIIRVWTLGTGIGFGR